MADVTQADREAARLLALSLFDGETKPENVERTWSEAFCRHRVAAEKNADMWKERVLILNRRERALIDWLRNAVPGSLGDEDDIADAIEAGSYPGHSA